MSARPEAGADAEVPLATLIERLSVPTCVVLGPDLVVAAANPAYQRMVGGRIVPGASFRELLPELERQGYTELLERVRDTGQSVRGDAVRVSWDRDGRGELTPGVVDLAYEQLPAAHGRAAGVVIQVIDRTEQLRVEAALREREARYEMVAAATRDLVWDWDLVNGQVDWNESVHAELGYGPGEVGAEPAWWYDHIHPDDRARVVAAIHRVIHDPAGAPRGATATASAGPTAATASSTTAATCCATRPGARCAWSGRCRTSPRSGPPPRSSRR